MRSLRNRVVVSALLAVPVVAIAMIPAFMAMGWQWLALAFTTPIVTWGAWPIHQATLVNLRHRATTMDTLISLGVAASFLWSARGPAERERGPPLLRGRRRRRRARARRPLRRGASRSIRPPRLSARCSTWAPRPRRCVDVAGTEREVPIDDVHVGDRFVVRPGEKIATDGVVVEGASAIDASLLTGESLPVEVGPGSPVTGATINVGGRLVVEATRVGADTALAQIGRLVTQAQSGKAQAQRLADRVSAVFVPAVILVAAVTLVAWLVATGDADQALTAAVAVLIVACPCALGLATPTALLAGTGRGAQLGILIRGPEVLETTRRLDTVVLDKTGTVTTGVMTLVDVVTSEGTMRDDALRIVGAVESASEHPIARAIASAAAAQGPLPRVDEFRSRAGLGVEGVVESHAVVAGRPALVADWSLPLPRPIADAVERGTIGWADGRRRGVGWRGARCVRRRRCRPRDEPGCDRRAARSRAVGGAAHRGQSGDCAMQSAFSSVSIPKLTSSPK